MSERTAYCEQDTNKMSKKGLKVRNLSPFLQRFRNFLLGRKHVPERATLRYKPLISARDQPPPVLPEGDAHKLSSNSYYQRDDRRKVMPPMCIVVGNVTNKEIVDIAEEEQGQSADVYERPDMLEKAKEEGSHGIRKKPVTPGKYWELSGLDKKRK